MLGCEEEAEWKGERSGEEGSIEEMQGFRPIAEALGC